MFEKSDDTKLGYLKFMQRELGQAKDDIDSKKAEINGKVKELETKQKK